MRQLREEVFALRRDKAVAEAKEGDVRRELSVVREQLDGMSTEQYKGWQKEHMHLKKQVGGMLVSGQLDGMSTEQ